MVRFATSNRAKMLVIYEAHVRDFTSDPAIAKDLTKPFGTFEAFY